MFRREALRKLGTVGVAVALAGCGSGASSTSDAPGPPQPPEGGGPTAQSGAALRIGSLDYREGDAGDLLLVVEVVNGDAESRSGTVRATVTLDGAVTETVEVTVAADDSETVEVPFDVPFDDFEDGGERRAGTGRRVATGVGRPPAPRPSRC